MLNQSAVFSWPGIILGALVFGFLFELVFILFEYLADGKIGLSPQILAFGAAAVVSYIVACMFVRRSISREE